jgi:hypothetical protein
MGASRIATERILGKSPEFLFFCIKSSHGAARTSCCISQFVEWKCKAKARCERIGRIANENNYNLQLSALQTGNPRLALDFANFTTTLQEE